MVVFRDEGTFEPATEMLSWESRTNPWIWEVIWIYCDRQYFLRLCDRTHLYWTVWCSVRGNTRWKWTCFETYIVVVDLHGRQISLDLKKRCKISLPHISLNWCFVTGNGAFDLCIVNIP
jgi:hypothetical protein